MGRQTECYRGTRPRAIRCIRHRAICRERDPAGRKERVNAEVEYLTFQLDEVTIHAAAAGRKRAPWSFEHGFPEFWYRWRGQIAPLAERGLSRCDRARRGTQSSKPQVQAYTVQILSAMSSGSRIVWNAGSFMLAGHDWGGVIAWACAMGIETRVSRLGILNAPHPSVFGEYARTIRRNSWRLGTSFSSSFRLPEFLFKDFKKYQAMTEALTKSSVLEPSRNRI